jgi:hypothetical protein
MAEIADDMVSGRCCSQCGIYFTAEHGFPVLCKGCWRHWSPRERKHAGLQKARLPEMGEKEGRDA